VCSKKKKKKKKKKREKKKKKKKKKHKKKKKKKKKKKEKKKKKKKEKKKKKKKKKRKKKKEKKEEEEKKKQKKKQPPEVWAWGVVLVPKLRAQERETHKVLYHFRKLDLRRGGQKKGVLMKEQSSKIFREGGTGLVDNKGRNRLASHFPRKIDLEGSAKTGVGKEIRVKMISWNTFKRMKFNQPEKSNGRCKPGQYEQIKGRIRLAEDDFRREISTGEWPK